MKTRTLVIVASLILTGAAKVVWGQDVPAVWTNARHLTERDVKAAFLVNFARFTEWPDGTFSSPSSPFVIGVAGDEGLRQSIDQVIRNRAVNGRTLRTRRVWDAKDLTDIQILYVGGTSSSRIPDLLKALSGQPVLTVGDGNRFCDEGGMVTFLREENRVRFEIRFDATEHAGLKVSSRVLTLAKAIHGKN